MIAIAEPTPPDPLQWQGLVRWVAKKHTGRGLDFDDLVSEGQFGLLRACELYDPDRDNQFNTYAVTRIKAAMCRAIEEKGRLIRVPCHLHHDGKAYRSSGARRDAAERVFRAGIVRDGDGDLCPRLADLVVVGDGPACEPDEDPVDMVAELLRSLTSQQAAVLRLRYGLGGEDPLDQPGIGRRMGVTKQRIQQIEVRAMKRLRVAAEERNEVFRA